MLVLSLLSFLHLVLLLLPLDSPFFNTPFLDFKTIFHPSCCDGKCYVTSPPERKKETQSCLNDLFHGMAICLNDLEHCGERLTHTATFCEMANWHVFCFIRLVNPEPSASG